MRPSRIVGSALFSRCVLLRQSATSEPAKPPTATEYKKLQDQLKELTTSVETAKTELLYKAAEADNIRKESRAKIEDTKRSGEVEFAKDMLNAADALEKTSEAARQCCAENPSLSPRLRSIVDGVQLSYQMIGKVLKRHGVEKMSIAVGTKFDPETEVSIYSCPATETVPDNHVAEVVKDGYTCHGKIIRLAQVGLGESP